MRIQYITITLVMMAALTACNDHENEHPEGIQSISYGTSFGECLGYCRKSITVTPSEIEFTKKGWDLDGQLPDSSFQQTFNQEEWNVLITHIDLESFLALDTVIGCPDCADGGAEWVEITFDGEPYKVTFEYKNAPGAMAPYIDSLRSYMERFE
jgi:hypothetical protein